MPDNGHKPRLTEKVHQRNHTNKTLKPPRRQARQGKNLCFFVAYLAVQAQSTLLTAPANPNPHSFPGILARFQFFDSAAQGFADIQQVADAFVSSAGEIADQITTPIHGHCSFVVAIGQVAFELHRFSGPQEFPEGFTSVMLEPGNG